MPKMKTKSSVRSGSRSPRRQSARGPGNKRHGLSTARRNEALQRGSQTLTHADGLTIKQWRRTVYPEEKHHGSS